MAHPNQPIPIDLNNPSSVTPDRLQRVADLLSGLKDDARAAYDANDTVMFGIYNELLRSVSLAYAKAQTRLERETRASFNKAHKSLRLSQRNGSRP